MLFQYYGNILSKNNTKGEMRYLMIVNPANAFWVDLFKTNCFVLFLSLVSSAEQRDGESDDDAMRNNDVRYGGRTNTEWWMNLKTIFVWSNPIRIECLFLILFVLSDEWIVYLFVCTNKPVWFKQTCVCLAMLPRETLCCEFSIDLYKFVQ